MKVLVVEDDPIAARVLEATLRGLEHEPVLTGGGAEALSRLRGGGAPRVVVSDWRMPDMDGLELCRRVRAAPGDYVYFILLTGLSATQDNQQSASTAGVDDFLTKPVNPTDLWMRLRVAERILQFTSQIRQLESFLPICTYCKNVRDDRNYWQKIEAYLNTRTGTMFSHGVCPDCMERVIRPQMEKLGLDRLPPT
jgi:CheY-like chemotaxis protein